MLMICKLTRPYWSGAIDTFRIYTPFVTTISYLEIKLQEDLASHQEIVNKHWLQVEKTKHDPENIKI